MPRFIRTIVCTIICLTAGAFVGGCASSSGSTGVRITTGPTPTMAAGSTTCRSGQLEASLGQGPDVTSDGAGTGIYLTNTGDHPCTIRGYATVSFLSGGPHGRTFGSPAARDHSGTYPTSKVVVRPGQAAAVVFTERLQTTARCATEELWGFRVLLPGTTTPIEVGEGGLPTMVCRTSSMVMAPVQDASGL